MDKICSTTCEQFYRDEPFGDLVYETEATTIRLLTGQLTIKVKMPKYFNWMQLADAVRCETRDISRWGNDLRKDQSVKSWDDLRVILSGDELGDDEDDFVAEDDESEVYTYFYDDGNWVMYESDDEYLFLYELYSGNHGLVNDDIDAIVFYPDDEVGSILSFLRSWYERVNGYRKEEGK